MNFMVSAAELNLAIGALELILRACSFSALCSCPSLLLRAHSQVANATHAPPIWVHAHLEDKGSKVVGISSKHAHYEARDACVEKFVKFFGRDPLVYSQLKVVAAGHSGLVQWLYSFWSLV